MPFATLSTVESFGNNDVTTLSSPMGSGDSVASVTSVAGFPTDGQFRLLVDSELMLVTGYDSVANQFQVTRGVEGTTAASHSLGAQVICILTKGSLVTLKQNTSGGTAFIYRDSEPNPTGNVFATFDGAYQAASALGVPSTIVIDDTLNQCSVGNAAGYGAAYTTVVGSTATITGLLNMTPDVVGLYLNLETEGPPGNNGNFPITAYLSPSSVQITNAGATPNVTSYNWFLFDGLEASITSADLLTLVTGDFGASPSMVGQTLTITGASNSGNNGTFPVVGYCSPTAVWINNPSAVPHDSGDVILSGTAAYISSVVPGTDGGQEIISGLTGITPELVGQAITVSNAFYAGPEPAPNNNGDQAILAYVSPTSLQILNNPYADACAAPDYGVGGTSEAPTINWSIQVSVNIGPVQMVGTVDVGSSSITLEDIGLPLMIQNSEIGGTTYLTGTTAYISSFSSNTGQGTITGLTGLTQAVVGTQIQISNVATGPNSGTFLIVSVNGSSTLNYLNVNGSDPDYGNGGTSEAPTINWSIQVVTNNDSMAAIVGYVDSSTVLWNNLTVSLENSEALWWYIGQDYDLSQITLAGVSADADSSLYVYDGVTWNEGVLQVSNLYLTTEFSYQQYLGTLNLTSPFVIPTTVNQGAVFATDDGGGIYDLSLAGQLPISAMYLTVDTGGVVSGGSGPWVNFGNNPYAYLEVTFYQAAEIGDPSSPIVSGVNGYVTLLVQDATSAPPVSFNNFYGISGNQLSIIYQALAQTLVPFTSNGPPIPNYENVAPRGPYNVTIGTMYFDTGANSPFWWTGSTWVTGGGTPQVTFGHLTPAAQGYNLTGNQYEAAPFAGDGSSYGVVIFGSDTENFSNITGNYSTFSGGDGAVLTGTYGFIGGGRQNSISASDYGVITGGDANEISDSSGYSFVGGGQSNACTCTGADSGWNVVVGGYFNVITSTVDDAYCNFIGGGIDNEINAYYNNTIAGGYYNRVYGSGGANNFIGGGYENTIGDNEVSPEVLNSTITGGYDNTVLDNYSAIVGGYENSIALGAQYGFIGGGESNYLNNGGYYSSVGGGYNNSISDEYATIAGGEENVINIGAPRSFIGGGNNNQVYGQNATICGGSDNVAGTDYSFIGGGVGNTITAGEGSYSVIVGGDANLISTGAYNIIAGGIDNQIVAGDDQTIGGGANNLIQGGGSGNPNYNTIAGGNANNIGNVSPNVGFATVGGGNSHSVQANYGTVAGGNSNTVSGAAVSAFVGGGESNEVDGDHSVIGGGLQNVVPGNQAAIVGGVANNAGGQHAFIGAGYGNQAPNNNTSALGIFAKATIDGATVTSSGSFGANVGSAQCSQFQMRGAGTATVITLGTGDDQSGNTTQNFVYLPGGGFFQIIIEGVAQAPGSGDYKAWTTRLIVDTIQTNPLPTIQDQAEILAPYSNGPNASSWTITAQGLADNQLTLNFHQPSTNTVYIVLNVRVVQLAQGGG